MKKMYTLLSLFIALLAVEVLVTAVPANATFIIDPNPSGLSFFIDIANKDASSFSGNVGGNNSGPVVNVSVTGIVDTGAGYANIKPVKDGLLTSLIFTPADNTQYGDFSFRGQLELDGDFHIKVIDETNQVFVFDFLGYSSNTDFTRVGVVSYDGEWIKSVEVYTTGDESFKEVKQIDFSYQTNPDGGGGGGGTPVPEPGTLLLLGAGLLGLTIFAKRKINR